MPEPPPQPAEKVKTFPKTPGVYLMKDDAGRVIYIGKAKNLKSRAGSYFTQAAKQDDRISHWVGEIKDIDYLEAESEIDAILLEARLIKDIQPKNNKDLKDSKSFPYLEIYSREDFPRVRFSRDPKGKGTKLFGPFLNPRGLKGSITILQKIFKFRTCMLDITEEDPRWQWYRPCLLASIDQCSAPCAQRIDREEYKQGIARLVKFLEGKRKPLLKEMREAMQLAAEQRDFEQAAKLRDEIAALESLDERGDVNRHEQPEVFPIDPKKGLVGLQKVLHLSEQPRIIEGVDIAHLGGNDTVASLVQFIDGLPFKPGYRRYRIRGAKGGDDYACIAEVVDRRLASLAETDDDPPDILLIDGGKGQLSAAMKSVSQYHTRPTTVLSLAKKEEEIYLPGESEPLRLSRSSFSLRLLQYVRDEAHRFAQHYHHILRKKSMLGE